MFFDIGNELPGIDAVPKLDVIGCIAASELFAEGIVWHKCHHRIVSQGAALRHEAADGKFQISGWCSGSHDTSDGIAINPGGIFRQQDLTRFLGESPLGNIIKNFCDEGLVRTADTQLVAAEVVFLIDFIIDCVITSCCGNTALLGNPCGSFLRDAMEHKMPVSVLVNGVLFFHADSHICHGE